MKHQIKIFCGLLIAFTLNLLYVQSLTAQTVAEIITYADSSNALRFENLDLENPPTKILLVYDSNLITLETSSTNSKLYTTRSSSTSTHMKYSSNSALVSLLAVEIENELELEGWMYTPFTKSKNTKNYLTDDSEVELTLESWMCDLNSW